MLIQKYTAPSKLVVVQIHSHATVQWLSTCMSITVRPSLARSTHPARTPPHATYRNTPGIKGMVHNVALPHKLLLIDRNSLVIIYVVKLRIAFHTSSFRVFQSRVFHPFFISSMFPPCAKRSRVSQSCVSTLAVWCRVFQCRVFPSRILSASKH